MKQPTKKQRTRWARLLERYAASDDPEQNVVVDIVNHLSEQLAQVDKRSAQNLKTAKLAMWSGGQYQQAFYARVRDQWAAEHKQKRSRRAGGKAYVPYADVHDLAEKLYWEDPVKNASKTAEYVHDLVRDDPAAFNFPVDKSVSYRTIQDELYKRIKEKKAH